MKKENIKREVKTIRKIGRDLQGSPKPTYIEKSSKDISRAERKIRFKKGLEE